MRLVGVRAHSAGSVDHAERSVQGEFGVEQHLGYEPDSKRTRRAKEVAQHIWSKLTPCLLGLGKPSSLTARTEGGLFRAGREANVARQGVSLLAELPRHLNHRECPRVAPRSSLGVDCFYPYGVSPRPEIPDVRADGL